VRHARAATEGLHQQLHLSGSFHGLASQPSLPKESRWSSDVAVMLESMSSSMWYLHQKIDSLQCEVHSLSSIAAKMKMDNSKNKCDVDPWQEHDPWSRMGADKTMDANAPPFSPQASSVVLESDVAPKMDATPADAREDQSKPVDTPTEANSVEVSKHEVDMTNFSAQELPHEVAFKSLRRCTALELRCKLPHGELDPCLALELVMGKAPTSTVIAHVPVVSQPPEKPCVVMQSDSNDVLEDREAAWNKFIQCLGSCSEEKLTVLREWRQGKLPKSQSAKAAQMWNKILAGFGSEVAAETALDVALSF